MEYELVDEQFNVIVGNVLREKRLKKGYSYQELSNKIDNIVTKQTLSNYEKCLTKIRIDKFIAICKALGESPANVWEEISLKYMQYVALNKDKMN